MEIPRLHTSEFQKDLTRFNRRRLTPVCGAHFLEDSAKIVRRELEYRVAELEYLQSELEAVRTRAAKAPSEAEAFVEWFEELRDAGPGQGDVLFPWLATTANLEEMRWFIRQEIAGEAGFDDLVALTQVRMPTPVKLELARNYWDEVGRGSERGMHGAMLAALADEMKITSPEIEAVVPESLALGNLMVGLASNRNFAFHSLGCLGAVELTAPGRARMVYEGLKRLGISPVGQRYYLLHSTLDLQHSIQWNREALLPLLKIRPECAHSIAEGALMRLSAGARCFARYRRELGISAAWAS